MDRDPETPEEAASLLPGEYFIAGSHLVLTSVYYRNRGRCCASGCQHCPFQEHTEGEVDPAPAPEKCA